jgi:hypothetical protein
MTSGSGGGRFGAQVGGRGGGSILIRCGALNITGGELRAEGGQSRSANIGSGSGGSITLLTTLFKGSNALLSVQGGAGVLGRNITAGSGGRIYIQVTSLIHHTPIMISFTVQGWHPKVLHLSCPRRRSRLTERLLHRSLRKSAHLFVSNIIKNHRNLNIPQC